MLMGITKGFRAGNEEKLLLYAYFFHVYVQKLYRQILNFLTSYFNVFFHNIMKKKHKLG